MKVLFINTVFGKGSTGRIVTQLGRAVEQAGGEYKVAYGRGQAADEHHGVRIGGTVGILAHALLARLTDRTGFFSRHATERLIAFIREYQPDVIHLHNLHGYYLHVGRLFRYLKTEYRGRVVWTLHDCWAFTGHCTHFTCAGCDKWQTACSRCPEKRRYPASLWIDASARNFRDKKAAFCGVPNMTIVTVSDWLKRETERSFLGEYPIIRIYNGIDCDKFAPADSTVRETYGIGADKSLILSVSDGWDERKGFDRLLCVADQAPDDWMFVTVGLARDQIGILPDNILGLQRIWNQQDLIALYAEADVFFNPSLEETFGLVTAEAMACGTPAVVMDSTACPELIVDPTAGTVVPRDADAATMVDAIRRTMPYTGARNAALAFTEQAQIDAHLALYNNGIR